MLLVCVVSWALIAAYVLLLCVACGLLADCRCSVLLAVGCVVFVWAVLAWCWLSLVVCRGLLIVCCVLLSERAVCWRGRRSVLW